VVVGPNSILGADTHLTSALVEAQTWVRPGSDIEGLLVDGPVRWTRDSHGVGERWTATRRTLLGLSVPPEELVAEVRGAPRRHWAPGSAPGGGGGSASPSGLTGSDADVGMAVAAAGPAAERVA
jgi:hypothetical protein